jgi:hypothetical protein
MPAGQAKPSIEPTGNLDTWKEKYKEIPNKKGGDKL